MRPILAVCVLAGLVSFSFSTLGISTSLAANKAEKDKKHFDKKMQELSSTLSSLLVDVTSSKRFNSPANFKKIDRDVKKFADLAHSVEAETLKQKVPNLDPSMVFMSSLFKQEAQRAYSALKSGNRAYARGIIRAVSSFCIGCHTTGAGPEIKTVSSADISHFNSAEKAEVYAATRQFEKAMAEYQNMLSDHKFAKTKQIEWEKGVRNALAIAVRVKGDPELAMQIVDKVLETPEVPGFFKEDANVWKASIAKWKQESKKSSTKEEDLLLEAKRLVSEARSVQKYPADSSGDILYMRASERVHELLRLYPNGKYSTEALYISGIAYEVLRDLSLWSLHELYYESCIRKSPHTELAQDCYHRYEETIYAGYSGSAGTSVPSDVAKRLQELKELAKTSVQTPH